jgi:hypothetical protein
MYGMVVSLKILEQVACVRVLGTIFCGWETETGHVGQVQSVRMKS